MASVFTLSGCGWLSEDVSHGAYHRWESTPAAVSALPAPAPSLSGAGAPESSLLGAGASESSLPGAGAPAPVAAADATELQQARARIAALESEIENLRNDMKMMMPALTKLSLLPQTAQTAADQLNSLLPAAGNLAGGEVGGIHRNVLQGDEFGDDYEGYQEQDAEAAADMVYDAPPPPLTPPPPPSAVAAPPGGMVPGAPVVVNAVQNTAQSAARVLSKAPPPPAIAPIPPDSSSQASSQARLEAPAPIPAQTTPVSYTPPAINVNAISNVRFGHHDVGKSRVVIEVSSAASFTYDVDNKEKILVIEIPSTVWNAGPLTRQIADHPLLQALTSQPDGAGGTTMVLELKTAAKVQWAQALPAAQGSGTRLVFDISAL